MELTPTTKVLHLIKTYDFMLDYLAGYAPEFKKLKNPVMRNTVGRFATLQMAASMANRPLDLLMADLQREIQRQTGEEVELVLDASALEPERLETLKGIIRDLHAGVELAQLRQRFAELLQDVSPAEIAQMEQQLIAEGLPSEEVKRLCDVHVQVFKESLDRQQRPAVPPGHPVHTFLAENQALAQVAARLGQQLDQLEQGAALDVAAVTETVDSLGQVELHYQRKENQLFPVLEQRGVVGPSQVMWAIHDDVRALFKRVHAALEQGDRQALAAPGAELVRTVVEMIYKEDNILLPMSQQLLDDSDWAQVRRGEEQIGYALVSPGDEWRPVGGEAGEAPHVDISASRTALEALPLDTGLLSLEMVNLMLKSLPVDLSLVDENDRVAYYSDSAHRIFPRSPGVIGRKVQLCHPQKSVHMVERILSSFRAGERDVAEFWIEIGGRFLHIRYFALRDAHGSYRGTLELSQDVTAIRALEGQQRLLDWNQNTEVTR